MNDYNDELFNAIASTAEDNVESYEGVQHSVGFRGIWDSFNHDFTRSPTTPHTNMNIRPEYNQADYQYYRPGEAEPSRAKQKMSMALNAYEHVPIVRNVMDMMADFTIEGMRIVHRDKNKSNFLKKWADKVNFVHVSERIAHMLYTLGTAPVKILEGSISIPIEREWNKSKGANDVKLVKPKYKNRVIPLGYKILNPMTMEVIGGEIATYIGRPVYGLKISQKLKMDMHRLEKLAVTNENFNDLIKHIPEDLKVAVKAGKQIVPLDQRKLEVLFYKKSDWQTWATPMLASIFDSLIQLEKLHLADISALDGAISQIRLWKLGIYNDSKPSHSILPKKAAINKLRNILDKLGTGVLDLVWGPELDFKESTSQVHNYLGPEKYEHVMSQIHAGLGIPQSLTGSSNRGGNSGMSNNAITMKTMVERLEYGRKIITKFWNNELIKIQKAMGWRFPAQIMYDRKVLADEAQEKKLILDMWDRDIYPTETVVELCGRDPELEILRHQKEKKKREADKMPEKASPYHNPDKEFDLKKIVLQGGGVAPSEVGLELEERKANETSKMEMMIDNKREKVEQKKNKPTSPGGDGRPKNSNDKVPRKKRKDKPRTIGSKGSFINLFLWGNEAQEKLSDMVAPFYLNHVDKKNLRSLTKAEFDKFENFKFRIFSCLSPYCKIDADNVYNIIENNLDVDEDLVINREILLKQFKNENERKPTVDEMRQIQSSAYALQYEFTGESIDVTD